MIHLESKGDPRAKSGQYLGLGQIGKSAWEDIRKTGTAQQFPDLTGGSDDPRYDPYTNALATAKLMGINRKLIKSAAQDAGYHEVTLGLLYAAHNIGAGSVRKILKEPDSSKWDERTKGFINNQAAELKQGGYGNYLANVDRSMAKHYASANVNVGSRQVAQANDVGVMSSNSPVRLASKQRGPEATEARQEIAAQKPVINVPVQVAQADESSPPVKRRNNRAQRQEQPDQQAQNVPQQMDNQNYPKTAYGYEAPNLFRLSNGSMAVI
jgi:hypothetical protein